MDAICLLDRVDGDHIGVIESRNRLSLALKPLQAFSICRHVAREKLQGNFAMQLGVLGNLDLAHATAAKCPGNSIVMQCRADHEERILRSERSRNESTATSRDKRIIAQGEHKR